MALFNDDNEARSERPTERRRRDARARGVVARSGELVSAARTLAVWSVLAWWLATFAVSAGELLRGGLSNSHAADPQPEAAVDQLRSLAMWSLDQTSRPLLIATAFVLVAHFAQVGWLWLPNRIVPQASRLSPLDGLQRLFSAATFGRGVAGFLKLSLLIAIGGMIVRNDWPRLTARGNVELTERLPVLASAALRLASSVALALLAWGVLDYFVQRWRIERSLHMTRDELRQEMKEVEGDPRVRQQRQSAARQLHSEVAATSETR